MNRWVGALCGAVLLVGTAAPAGAEWPQLGGTGSRPGNQPDDRAGLPVEQLWHSTTEADRDVRTSLVTTPGAPADQRVAFGTSDGRVHLRRLQSGLRVGPVGGVDVSNDAFPFGAGRGTVTPVVAALDGPGQLYVLHNETVGPSTRIELARVDVATGELAGGEVVVATGARVDSSPLLTGAGADRVLWFVARGSAGGRLYRVPITAATTPAPSVGTTTVSADLNANEIASPTLVSLNDAGGTATDYVAVATNGGSVLTFPVAEALPAANPGPVATGLGRAAYTPSVPVAPDGSRLVPSPAIYVGTGDPERATVHKLTQDSASQQLDVLSSALLPGQIAPGLATGATSVDGPALGMVYVTTGRNLFALDGDDLAVVHRLAPGDDLSEGSTGFSWTVPAVSGDVLAVTRDGGAHVLVASSDLSPLPADQFTAFEEQAPSTRSTGQPAISRRHIQLASDRGVFVYKAFVGGPPTGYWAAAADGGVYAFGEARFHGSLGDQVLNQPIVTMAGVPEEDGYWLVGRDGGVFAFGAARFWGSTGDLVLNQPIVAMAATPSGRGYWLVAADGGVFSFGDAVFHGSTGDLVLNRPIVGVAPTPSGNGYWLVASDGGVFSFGDALFWGSTGDLVLNRPITAMAAVPTGRGYWLFASDGGVFSFGQAPFFGSTAATPPAGPVVAAAVSPSGKGYVLASADGGVFPFGDVPFLGAPAQFGALNHPLVGVAVR